METEAKHFMTSFLTRSYTVFSLLRILHPPLRPSHEAPLRSVCGHAHQRRHDGLGRCAGIAGLPQRREVRRHDPPGRRGAIHVQCRDQPRGGFEAVRRELSRPFLSPLASIVKAPERRHTAVSRRFTDMSDQARDTHMSRPRRHIDHLRAHDRLRILM